jgi:hypothetical protein
MTLRQEVLMTVRFNLQNIFHLRLVALWCLFGIIVSLVFGVIAAETSGASPLAMRLVGAGGYVVFTILCFVAIVVHDVAYHEISELEERRSAGIMTFHGPW